VDEFMKREKLLTICEHLARAGAALAKTKCRESALRTVPRRSWAPNSAQT